MGTGQWPLRPRLAATRPGRRARARHLRRPGHPDVRRTAVARPALPGDRGGAEDGTADRLGRPPGSRLHPPRVPLPRRTRHPQNHRTLRLTPGRHRLPGRQRTRQRTPPQPRRLPAVHRPAARAVRRRGDPEPRMGPGLLVAPARHLGRPVDPRQQRAAPVRPGLAPLPGRPHHRVHRLAGGHRARVRATRPVRHHVHRLRTPGHRGRSTDAPPRRHRRQPLLRDAGRPRPPRGTAVPAGLDHLRHLGPVPQRGPHVLLATGVVPRHGDQRPGHRRQLAQPPGVRRAVAAGGMGAHLTRCLDDRVLALAHAALRYGDVLGRHPAPQRPPRPRLPRTRHAGQ